MKKMFNFSLIVTLFSSITIISCSKMQEEANQDNNQNKILVKLNITGEVSVDEAPLTKAFSSGDLLGIQVKEGSSFYAYGLFDDPSVISIYLHSGKVYSFECCLVKNGEALLKTFPVQSTDAASIKYGSSTAKIKRFDGGYALPFMRGPGGTSVWTSTGVSFSYVGRTTPITNKFVYTSDTYFTRLGYGQLTAGEELMYPNASVFYGKLNNVVGVNDLSIPIELKSGSFGVSLSVSGITDGNVTVTIKNNAQTFHTNSNITQDTQFGVTTWTYYDLASAYQYADNYTENFTIGVVWNRGVGVTQNLGTKIVQFKRNAVNHIKVDLSTSTRSSGSASALEEPIIKTETY